MVLAKGYTLGQGLFRLITLNRLFSPFKRPSFGTKKLRGRIKRDRISPQTFPSYVNYKLALENKIGTMKFFMLHMLNIEIKFFFFFFSR